MTDHTPGMRSHPPTAAVLRPADYAELLRELDDLRRRHRGDDAAFAEARIAQLEHFARFVTVVAEECDVDGVAGLGSVVRVADALGRTMEYELVGRRAAESKAREVSLSSPVGKALTGVRAGDTARVALPSGEVRVLSVLEVRPSKDRTGTDPAAEAA